MAIKMSRKSISPQHHYKRIAPLAAYIDKIGAEQINFRKFIVKKHFGHYYSERCTITIKPDGSITASDKDYLPEADEAKAISAAIQDQVKTWPRSIGAKNIDALIKVSGAKRENLAEFYSRKDGTIIFVQERRQDKSGAKHYLPWTFFSDGSWLMMEPDGALPFWKPKNRTNVCTSIMIHEGAKTARYVDWLVNSVDKKAKDLRKTHPWIDELSAYEHWGMIGGAKAPGRTDYNELRSENPTRVVYICDNDLSGKDALQKISEYWGEALKGVYFDNRWPTSWDLADEFSPATCPKLFSKTGRYNGPTLKELMIPATFATKTIPNKQGKPTHVIKSNFLEEWYHCVHPEVFIHRDTPNKEYDLKEFNIVASPFSNSPNTGLLVQSHLAHKTATLAYDPGKPPGIFIGKDGKQCINTHTPSGIRPEKGDCEPWEKYIEHLFPDKKDRYEVIKWIATLICHPEEKMHYSILLISEAQGVGKTTLGKDIVAPILGWKNVSSPSEVDIVESQFNDWCAQKRLITVEEIYAGHNSKAYDRLKSIVTDKTITVNKKYQAAYSLDNWAHVIATSNSFRALKMTDEDRRWLIPKVTETLKPRTFWAKFHEWLDEDNGLGKIMWWCYEFCKREGYVRTGDAAPWSMVKRQVIEETMSPGMLLVANLLDQIKESLNGSGEEVFVTDIQLIQFIKDTLYEGRQNQFLERPLTVRKLAKSRGWFINDQPSKLDAFGSAGIRARLLWSGPKKYLVNPDVIAKNGLKPFNINSLTKI